MSLASNCSRPTCSARCDSRISDRRLQILILHTVVDDVSYFSQRKARKAWDYELAKQIEKISSGCDSDRVEFSKRLASLMSATDPVEHQMQSGNFVSELCAFEDLRQKGYEPHWVPESSRQGVKSPDIQYQDGDNEISVEVKTLGLDQDEGRALRSHQMYVPEQGPDENYFNGCMVKLDSFFADAEKKFKDFNSDSEQLSVLYVYFFPSLHVRLRDGEDGLPHMKDRIISYASDKLPNTIACMVIDVLSFSD